MGERTAIGWTDDTWNPWQGCHKVSAGCRECYMFREKRFFGQNPDVVVRSRARTFRLPLGLAPGRKVFACSWSDWWLEEADPWRAEAWDIIDRRRDLVFQLVTKRIERAPGRLPWGGGRPWPHVWMLVSVEHREAAERRLPALAALNVAVRGVSYEPALEPVDYRQHLAGMDWLIMGVESGPRRGLGRTLADYWCVARAVRAQCQAAGVAFFQKQGPIAGRLSVDPAQWAPEDRVQEFPRVPAG